jgi:hypothetical protein
LHFLFRFDTEPAELSEFVNLCPLRSEDAIYTTRDQKEQTYGIIAYLFDFTNSCSILIVAALNTAGVQAAAAFALGPSSMMPICKGR